MFCEMFIPPFAGKGEGVYLRARTRGEDVRAPYPVSYGGVFLFAARIFAGRLSHTTNFAPLVPFAWFFKFRLRYGAASG